MRRHCLSKTCPEYSNYGGRGITICSRWLDGVQNFLDDMGTRPSKKHEIDRINNDGNYEPLNCRWATRTENCRNRRSSRFLIVNGQKRTLIEWSELSGVPSDTLFKRLSAGWDDEKAVNALVRARRSNGNAKPVKSPCINCSKPSTGNKCITCSNKSRSISNQIHKCGNAVPPPFSKAVVEAACPDLIKKGYSI